MRRSRPASGTPMARRCSRRTDKGMVRPRPLWTDPRADDLRGSYQCDLMDTLDEGTIASLRTWPPHVAAPRGGRVGCNYSAKRVTWHSSGTLIDFHDRFERVQESPVVT